jgi:hypothetical protein
MAQAFAADLRLRNFDAALIADYSAMFHSLVLSAQTFPISYRTKNTRTEETIALWFKCPIVNSLRFGDLTV